MKTLTVAENREMLSLLRGALFAASPSSAVLGHVVIAGKAAYHIRHETQSKTQNALLIPLPNSTITFTNAHRVDRKA